MRVVETGNEHVFTYVRGSQGRRMLLAANFSEPEQHIPADRLGPLPADALPADALSGEPLPLNGDLKLGPYQFVRLTF